MPVAHVNGVDIAYEVAGESGPPMVLVHGSWVSGSNWAFVVPGLSESFRVVTYDRRGHNGSSGAPRGGLIGDDVEDLAALIRDLGLGQAHIIGSSYGSIVSLRFASAHPELVLSVNGHEPVMVDMLRIDPADADVYESFWNDVGPVRAHLEAGENAAAAKAFVEGMLPGAWEMLPEAVRAAFAQNGPTFLDEMNDREAYSMTDEALGGIGARCLLTEGSESPRVFSRVIAQLIPRIPDASLHRFEGAGHVPHQSHVAAFVKRATSFALGR